MQPDTRYAKSGDVHIAYQVFGEGALNVVFAPPAFTNVEHWWDEPEVSRWLLRLASYARVVMFDKRGTGLSDRVADSLGLDQRMDDLRAVMDATGIEQAALLGISEGGTMSALFAATYPSRCRALVLCNAYPASRFAQSTLEQALDYIERDWGSGGSVAMYAPSRMTDSAFKRWWGKNERVSNSPAGVAAYARMNHLIDISDIIPTIRVPTLVINRTEDRVVSVEGGRFLAKQIPGSRHLEFPGVDHLPFVGDNAGDIADAIEEFLTGSRPPVAVDRVLATVLFTDIVGSTEKAATLGDHRWRDLLEIHHTAIRRTLSRFRGHEIKTIGDGVLATFDGPARAVRCACAIAEEIRPLGIEVRAGLHTGECEVIGNDIGGIAVHIGARVAALAGASEVLVSSTVRDLVAGSGLRFGDRGNHSLKGIPGDWRIFAVER
ncbi:adenylate/guanylate cyclase domain-containing protein [Bradyrhizobium sp. I71]|uniref:adenylate/guanylate cyclase domain-containing protein n=1 Tax=Bradyrhizobium sp. I71 TaxID=2590772 RepID=UPI001EF8FE0C|nr:adenylate/guanylate cyclase domain-containing protein [Bradyrhizobium sp. I71]ULL00766.1 adenylate/guanylate cyclase domain-containing protein [Bradyrhizobium sp. I71]